MERGHGDQRQSVDRHGLNVYGGRRRPANTKLKRFMEHNMGRDAIVLNEKQRAVVKEAIKEVCDHRGFDLWAINILTNHAHAVVSTQSKPELIADAFKSYSSRKLREVGLIRRDIRPWARGRSRRYLWKPHHVSRAIDYVLYGQGDIIPDFDD